MDAKRCHKLIQTPEGCTFRQCKHAANVTMSHIPLCKLHAGKLSAQRSEDLYYLPRHQAICTGPCPEDHFPCAFCYRPTFHVVFRHGGFLCHACARSFYGDKIPPDPAESQPSEN